jgi:hypothetical protein
MQPFVCTFDDAVLPVKPIQADCDSPVDSLGDLGVIGRQNVEVPAEPQLVLVDPRIHESDLAAHTLDGLLERLHTRLDRINRSNKSELAGLPMIDRVIDSGDTSTDPDQLDTDQAEGAEQGDTGR